ncbi:1-deoxy-D-xylulose 5-phosphate reductoisomerase [Candidatus Terasakiella magnetica]|uniref:1-deoxy-D-xylulose 5-phosphate reductoisomerase n=1 Tax=Candidatus Terasakiella magnetica TaxID=1867952 RepID=A0A1C3RCM2_9PROT|nr:1-deoxy-D-xylulose-5-phosphate reductoisomerase [Candidatus Terasakiella magnetica]SCA55026.1 1-deoxy-D-xylulose 5-phosphate reductoisomerase [Candidatus Terasakiella magnetica]
MVLKKSISILGSTGSIGTSTIDLISKNPDQFNVVSLTGNSNIELLAKQAKDLKADFVCSANGDNYQVLKEALSGTDIEVGAGESAVLEAAQRDAQWVMASIVGAAGLAPTFEAIKRGATIGLANKESLVCAGDLMMQAVKDHGATLLPVDSEHNAIFQVLDFDRPEGIDKIILTASGGPFRTSSLDKMSKVTPKEAVAHPNWSMGAKISVDSASMMNKGLELIEAFHLFPVEEKNIDVLVHPQSVIHSMVSYIDGSVLAQLGSPDMRTPIAYALAWPQRMKAPSAKLNLAEIAQLNFEEPDLERFPALRLAREALQTGKSAPCVLNGVNEIAVSAFLNNQIGFLDIPSTVEAILSKYEHHELETIEQVIEADKKARQLALQAIEKISK